MEHELFIPSRPREQRQVRGRHGRASDKGDPRARRARQARRVARAESTNSPNHKLIERGLNGDRCGGVLAMRVADLAQQLDRPLHRTLRRTLHALDRAGGAVILLRYELFRAVGHAVAMHDRWIRKPDAFWADPDKKEQAQLNALLRHLFCAYRVPVFFNWAWTTDDGTVFCAGGRQWYVHVGAGGSLRTAPDLPFPLSRAAAHAVMNAPAELTLPQAMRYGQFVALGVSHTLAVAAVQTRLGRSNMDDETALAVGRWLAANGDCRCAHVQQIIDYVIGRRGGNEYFAPQPDFHLGHRMPPQVMRDITQWHWELNRARSMPVALAWSSCGIGGFDEVVVDGGGGAIARWNVVELTTQQALTEEGRAMRHCVASFGPSCARRDCAIFALRRTEGVADGAAAPDAVRHVATIEVELPARRIAQVSAACNRQPNAAAMNVIKRWAEAVGVSMDRRQRW